MNFKLMRKQLMNSNQSGNRRGSDAQLFVGDPLDLASGISIIKTVSPIMSRCPS